MTATDPAAKTITLKVGSKTVTVTASDKTEYHRYSLDSAKPADAKPSSFAEIKVGDQAHVLGNKNEDGTATTAESIYAGRVPPIGGDGGLDQCGERVKCR